MAARPAELVRLVAPLRVAELRPSRAAGAYARQIRRAPGIAGARLTVPRRSVDLQQASADDVAREWQYYSVGVERVPRRVAAAAARLTIAVVDTGADVTSPALAHKVRGTYNAHTGRRRVRDTNGHGTFVASLAGGVRRRADGFVGFGGAARLLIVKVSDSTSFSDVAVAGGIVYAVRHHARIVNLSVAGPAASVVEQAAIRYAARHGVLVVAAAGNDALAGDPPEYPAAFLQPVGSNGIGGLGISVGASDSSGARAAFSEYGSFVSLAAPGESVFGARLHGHLRLCERNLVRRPRGSRRGRPRLGRGPEAHVPAGRRDPEAHRDGARDLESGPRLRCDRRGGGCAACRRSSVRRQLIPRPAYPV